MDLFHHKNNVASLGPVHYSSSPIFIFLFVFYPPKKGGNYIQFESVTRIKSIACRNGEERIRRRSLVVVSPDQLVHFSLMGREASSATSHGSAPARPASTPELLASSSSSNGSDKVL
jgi:hypothetical protein